MLRCRKERKVEYKNGAGRSRRESKREEWSVNEKDGV